MDRDKYFAESRRWGAGLVHKKWVSSVELLLNEAYAYYAAHSWSSNTLPVDFLDV